MRLSTGDRWTLRCDHPPTAFSGSWCDVQRRRNYSLTKRIQNAGTEVVEAKAGGGSATLSMGQAAARFGLSLLRAMQGESNVVECAYVEGKGEHTRFFAQPVLLGKNGIAELLDVGKLSAFEQQSLESMLDILRKDIELGEQFINN